MAPESVDPQTKLAYVLPTMQLGVIPVEPPVESPTEPEMDLAKLTLENRSTDSALLAPLNDSHSSSSLPSSEAETAATTPETEPESEFDAVPETEESEFETLPETPYGHIFAIGDAADAFGAIKAGHTAYWQAEVAARNIIRLARHHSLSSLPPTVPSPSACTSDEQGAAQEAEISRMAQGQKAELELESYVPGPPAIKVSLGVGQRSAYQIDGRIGRKDTVESDDLDVEMAWPFFGINVEKPEDMLA